MLSARPRSLLLVAVFTLVVTFVHFEMLLLHPMLPTRIACYYTLCFLLANGLVFRAWKSSENRPDPLLLPVRWSTYLVVLALGLVVWNARYFAGHTLGLDEYTHAIQSFREPAHGSAVQQQPILGYLYSDFLTTVMGFTPLALRLTGLLPTVGAFLLFGLSALELGLGPWALSFLALSFAGLDVFRYAATEGRSMGMGLFTLALLWCSWQDFQRRPARSERTVLGIAAFFFLCSIGAQPVIVLLTFCLLVLVSWWRTREAPWMRALQALGGALLAFAPIQYYISKIARGLGYLVIPGTAGFSSLFQLSSLKALVSYWFPQEQWTLWLLLYGGLLWTLWQLRQRPYRRLPVLWLLTYPLVFDLIFRLSINWELSERYRTCYIALLCLALAYVLDRLPRWEWKALVVLMFGLCLKGVPKLPSYDVEISRRTDWAPLPAQLDRDFGEGRWRAYVTGECDTYRSWWCQSFFVGAEFFRGKGELHRMQRSASQDNLINDPALLDNGMMTDFNLPWTGARTIVVVLAPTVRNSGWPSLRGLSLPFEKGNFRLRQRGDFVVLESTSPMEAKPGIMAALEWLTREIPQTPANYFPYEILARNYGAANDFTKLRETLARLRAIPGFEALTHNHPLIIRKLAYLDYYAQGHTP